MTKRVMAVAAAMGLVFLLTAYARNLFSPHQLAVYDAYGKRVGVVSGARGAFGGTGSGFKPIVSFKFQDVPFMLMVYRDGFQATEGVVWESTDCSGQPFIRPGIQPGYPFSPSSLPVVAVGIPGSTVYVENGPARSITVRSFSTSRIQLDGRFPEPSRCYSDGFTPYSVMAVPARPLVDMNDHFTPPFTVH